MSIQVKKISKSYNSNQAVDGVNFTIEKGEIVGFLGPNGAGKSTVMKIITGFIKDFEGEVIINGQSVREKPLITQKQIGYLPEHNPLYSEMYVKEYLNFNAEIYKVSKNRISEIIDSVGLASHAGKKIKELSKGYRQRVGLAAALLHDPEVLILDEPTTGLDPNQLIDIRNLIKKVGQNKIVLFSTHIMQEVEAVCNRVIIIDNGRIVTDKPLQELEKTNIQIIEVEFDKKPNTALIEQINSITSYKKINDTTWELSFESKEDKRATVFDFAQHSGLRILNMTHKTTNLESAFRELTGIN
jgi:ABC-2 type transport system ATP-binding protein